MAAERTTNMNFKLKKQSSQETHKDILPELWKQMYTI